jgi:hypothetical protein
MAAASFIVTRRFYQVTYEWRRLVVVAVVTALCYAGFSAMSYLPDSMQGTAVQLFLKCGLLAAYAGLFFAARFFTSEEIGRMRIILTRANIRRIFW